MTDFTAYSADTEVLGDTFLALSRQAMASLSVPEEEVQAWLAARGIARLEEHRWYPWQVYLDFYRWIAGQKGPEGLRELGRSLPRAARFPPEVKTLERALRTLDIAYHLNHRGGEFGNYLCEQSGPSRIRLHCENPYGCDVDTGILEALIARFAPPGSSPTLAHAAGSPCRGRGGRLCIYEITW